MRIFVEENFYIQKRKMNFIKKFKTQATKTVNTMMTNPTVAKSAIVAGMLPMLLNQSAFATSQMIGAITNMVGVASTVVMGVGIVYAIIAVFNWVSAIKQEDSERASKSIVNIFVAVALILIKPITSAVLSGIGDSGNYLN